MEGRIKIEVSKAELLLEKVKELNPRSAWDKGVKEYAIELMYSLIEHISGGYDDFPVNTTLLAFSFFTFCKSFL